MTNLSLLFLHQRRAASSSPPLLRLACVVSRNHCHRRPRRHRQRRRGGSSEVSCGLNLKGDRPLCALSRLTRCSAPIFFAQTTSCLQRTGRRVSLCIEGVRQKRGRYKKQYSILSIYRSPNQRPRAKRKKEGDRKKGLPSSPTEPFRGGWC